MSINLDKWDFPVGGNTPQTNAGANVGAGKAVEHVKVDDYSEALKSVGNTALPISERAVAVEQLQKAVTGEKWGCVEREYSDGPGGSGKTTCSRHGYLPVRNFGDAPLSPDLAVLKFASFFSNDTVQRVKDALSREKANAEALFSSSKGEAVSCEVDESFHYKSEIVCRKG